MSEVFVGTYERPLDDKGRFVLPAALRTPLGGGGMMAAWDGCLGIWPERAFEAFVGELVDAGHLGSSGRRRLMWSAQTVSPDKQGRIGIPERLKSALGVDGQVVVTGNWDRIEIWEPEAWAAAEAAGDEELVDAVREHRL
jgi:MraZ protein